MMKSRLHPIVKLVALGTLALLYLPMGAIAVFSVNDSERSFVWQGFTLRWYAQLFDVDRNPMIRLATWNTIQLAVISTAIATLVGTMLAIGMQRYPWAGWFRHVLELVLHLPVVTPDIILAAALVVALALLRAGTGLFEPGMINMVLGHVTFQIPFVALVVRSRLATLGAAGDEAARDLYAQGPYVLRRVTLPLLAPGIVSGAMLAFTLSLDDFVISFFTAGPDSITLPVYIYGELRKGITATTHALSTLIFLATVVLVIGIERLSRRSPTETRP